MVRRVLASAVAIALMTVGLVVGSALPAVADEVAPPGCKTYFLYDPTGSSVTPRGGAALCDPSAEGTQVRVVVDCAPPTPMPPDARVYGAWVNQDGRSRSIAWCPDGYTAVAVSAQLR
ncbi:MAG: hypothetical protein GEU94_12655 [Micromonosporaceae bacterium]|nr:hypothetical protein [Micromonosporaceae bacterium]